MSTTAVVETLLARAQTVAAAESLTGGLVASAFVTTPGASKVFRGGVVAYDADIKIRVVGVPAETIEEHGVVSPETAAALASGVRSLLGTDWGVGTTGVAGPEPHGGHEPGTVCLAVAGPGDRMRTETLVFTGSREDVRRHAVDAALRLLIGELAATGGKGAC
ncbi:CinA family protein [Phytomonospora endophytica]|uniref:Nicotinamide-nucleotide amidase n=1 Tax=Phytomonospora endophytica TaxID=714109 RepID=A0A841FK55_9ACTN|nr:nicotinamide-nucleotide amidohydrolase family protein [Phytomonospora endophytica]MBB6033527.1 nicotinamide-nucleotide amidase [Phytomonospora endophytica]GIG64955.1 competence protein [Phytomonospora endophytica]